MRPARLLILALAALLAAGCVQRPPPPAAAVVVQPATDLDSLAYGAGPRYVAARPVITPVAGPAPRSGYTLDSGDKLRVVVFGQDGLTNSYNVDAAGNITMPLIGTVPARGLSSAELSAAIGARLKQGFIREPHVAVEIESLSAVLHPRRGDVPGPVSVRRQHDGRDRGGDRRRLHAARLPHRCGDQPHGAR